MCMGSTFIECKAGTDEFKRAVPEGEYRSQIIQDAAALSLNKILMVYSPSGALSKLTIIISVSDEQREAV